MAIIAKHEAAVHMEKERVQKEMEIGIKFLYPPSSHAMHIPISAPLLYHIIIFVIIADFVSRFVTGYTGHGPARIN